MNLAEPTKPMAYADLAKVNVNEHIERKQNLAYLSWAWAVDYIFRLDENATWEYREHDGKPYVPFPDGTCMVYCSVTLFGRKRTAHLPVMDHRNKAIINPDAFSVNTAMQRALVKAIALHGLGLYIYAGEDVPNDDKPQLPAAPITPTTGAKEELSKEQIEKIDALASTMLDMFNAGLDVSEPYAVMDNAALTNEEKVYLWTWLDSKQRAALKKHHKSLTGGA